MSQKIRILAFESSCDETSVAIVEDGQTILANVVASQVQSHIRFGGVVPEVASRHHVEQISQVTRLALEQAGVTWQDIDAIAVTQGPGLVGAPPSRDYSRQDLGLGPRQALDCGQSFGRPHLCQSNRPATSLSPVGPDCFGRPYRVGLYA